MAKSGFVHLRVHSDYSMIDGLAKTEPLVKKTAKLGMPALAITDFTNLCGLIKFYRIAHNIGLKPIIGADFQVQSNLFKYEMTHLTILAMNNIGYNNLMLLISKAYQRGYGALGPWIDRNWLIDHSEGILLLSGGRMGDIGRSLHLNNSNLINKCLDFYQQYFPNRFYLELIRTGRPGEETYLHAAVALAEDYNLPVVATNDVRFIDKDDFDIHEIRVAIHDRLTLDDPKRLRNYSPQQYMRSAEEMSILFADIPEALENSIEIAKRCNVTINFGEYFLPQFPTGNMTTENFLIKKSKEGLEERLEFLFKNTNERNKYRQEYEKRLNTELQVINQMGFPGYFLIVMEFVQWSKNNGILVGPGRGSGAGSLVAYALKITDINPIEFDLLFERFLNSERISMPDFDIDFCMEKRDKVIEHVADVYGRDAVSQIITLGTMAAKAVIRDVGRVLGYPYNFVDRIAKLIPLDPGITLSRAFKENHQLMEFYKTNEEVRTLIKIARKLEGVTRNAGKHAGGVVIAPTKITDFVPIYCDESGQYPVTQFDKSDLESIGLVKFDFLGLRTLTVIDLSLDMINKKRERNNQPLLNISNIPLNDKESFEMLQRSETMAVFQLESQGMKDLIKRLRPDCFEDMIALVALFRPGPLQSGMVDNFINRKHGREAISYPDIKWQHEILKPILESTYGIILYQEQVMKIAQVFSGYTLGDADILRIAMGKKKPEEMIKQRTIFEHGAIKNGIDGKLAIKIFDLVEKFAGYGFNKSHSAAYALVSYHTLWLKTHYPAEFMAAAMSADMDNNEKIVELIKECWRMGLKILPPDINSGLYHFYVNNNDEIVYGIGAIKGIGESSIEAILKARNCGGCFHELFDLCVRIDTKKLNRKTLEKLIISGAFDKLGPHRAALMNSLDNTLQMATQFHKKKKIGQIDMFSGLAKKSEQIVQSFTNSHPWSEQIILDGERETLGIYLTGHPINQYLTEIKYYTNDLRLKDMHLKCGKSAKAAGLVLSSRIITNKHNHRIGICTIDDHTGSLEVVLFPDILNDYKHLLKRDNILIVSGQISFDNFTKKIKMFANKVMDINQARKKYVHGIAILLADKILDDQILNKIYQLLKPYRYGDIPVYIYYYVANMRISFCLGKTWYIILNDKLLNDLRMIFGFTNVILEFD